MSRFKLCLSLILAWAVLVGTAEAACTGSNPTWSSTPDLSSLQTCVNNAANGATINVAAGSATWSGSLSWTNKNIAIIGAGVGSTVITANGNAVTVSMSNPVQAWRISGFTFQGSSMNTGLFTLSSNISGATSLTKGWRVDHLRLNYSVTSGVAFWFQGVTAGLVDHVVLDGQSYYTSLYEGWMGSSSDENGACSGTAPNVCFGYYAWNSPSNLGSDEAVYFEDLQVNITKTAGDPVVSDLLGGGRMVVRFSSIRVQYWITHSARYELRGGKYWEVYRNTFNGAASGCPGTNCTGSGGDVGYRWAQIRSGTGVAFSNTVINYGGLGIDVDGQREAGTGCELSNPAPLGNCNGAKVYDVNTEGSGWQCLDQIGRGGGVGSLDRASVQSWKPWFSWWNGTSATCATGASCTANVHIGRNCDTTGGRVYWKSYGETAHTNGEVDYVNDSGVGKGTIAARPASCTKGQGYWATDEGEWNSLSPGADGRLYLCTATNTWTLYYTPYTYPHPLQGGTDTTPPAAPTGVTITHLQE